MSSDEDEALFRRPKRYKLMLDPNYEPSMVSEKTRKSWTEASELKLAETMAKYTEPSATSSSLPQFDDAKFLSNDEQQGLPADEDALQDCDQFYNESTEDEADYCEEDSTTDETPLKENPSISEEFSNFENGQKIMFKQSGMTVNDVVELIVAFSVRFGCTHQQREWMVEMFKNCAGPEFETLKLSNYKLSQVCNPPPDKIFYHFYCDQCSNREELLHSCVKKEIKGQSKLCSKCKKEHFIVLSNPNYFLTNDLEYQLRLLFNDKEVATIVAHKFNTDSTETSDFVLRDISDSKLHKSVVQFDNKIFTYIISTDGAPLFKMSKRSFWPLQILLNFLPPHLRFKIILMVGIMIVRHEPKPDLMNLFIYEFMKQARRLHSDGLKVKLPEHDEEIILKFAPICVVADSVARPILQNRLQYNGYYGCSYCYHNGQHVHEAGMKYPFLENEPELRTHSSHMKDIANLKKLGCPTMRGVKGESAFCSKPNVDMVWGFPVDYVHNSVLGVTEQMWIEWNKNVLSPAQRREIDEQILLIQPPRELHRAPEKISTKSIWKATHWKSWLIFYSLPILSKFLRKDMLEHYTLFVNSVYALLQMEITQEQLRKCEEDLMIFVSNFQMLYGIERMTFNVHILLHAVISVKMSGPLWGTSAFPFEHNIHSLKDMVNGPKSVEQQMSANSLTRLSYQCQLKNPNRSKIVNTFCENLFSTKTETKCALKFENVTFFGPSPKNQFQEEHEFARCLLNHQVYSSIKYLRSKKFNDTIVQLQNGKIAQITRICCIPYVKCWVELKELILKPFFAGDVKVDHIWEVTANVELSPITLIEIKSKIVCLDLQKKQYVCMMPNSIEAQ